MAVQHGIWKIGDKPQPVSWLHKVPEVNSVNEVGLFGNQNSVARPRTPKWVHTVKRLKEIWHLSF